MVTRAAVQVGSVVDLDACRRQRVRLLRAQIDAGEVEPEAMADRYGIDITAARAAVATRAPRPRVRPVPQGRVKGLWMAPDVESALRAHGRRHGGQGRALAHALRLLDTMTTLATRTGRQRVTVDVQTWAVTIAAPETTQRPTATSRATDRWRADVEARGQATLGGVDTPHPAQVRVKARKR